MRSPAELTELFREQGYKVTPQREAVFRVLDGNDAHPTAESVHAAVISDMPSVSLRTVYGVLNDLAAMGELQLLDMGTGSTRFDPNVGDHHHVVCSSCGEVRDVYVRGSGPNVSDLDGFHVESTDIVFRGLCASCAAAERSNTTTNTHRSQR